MTAFQVTTSGNHDQRLTFMAFDGITFTAPGTANVQLNSTQFNLAELTGTPLTFTGNARVNTVEVFVTSTFNASSIAFASWSLSDAMIFRDTTGNETIVGSTQNDRFFITGGTDTVVSSGGNDTINIDWRLMSGAFSMNGATQFTNFSNTNLNFTGSFSFNILLSTTVAGNDVLTLGSGSDSVNSGLGDDSINTGAGNATMNGGLGNDLWGADFSAKIFAATINLNLGGTQLTGNGSSYTSVERLNVIGSNANDVFTTRIGNPNDGLGDTLSGGAGDDTLTVGGGTDFVDGGADNDLLIINYAGDTNGFNANGPTQFTDFTNTTVNFSNIERFNVTLGEGADNITTGAGDDTLNGNGGNDTLNSGAGVAVIDGGAGNDLWAADLSAQAGAKTIDLALAGINAAGDGTTYAGIESISLTTGIGNDEVISLAAIFNDTINSGEGNDTLGVGGGVDSVNGGLGDDLLIIDYRTVTGDVSMNGASEITNFVNTRVDFFGIERFNIKLGAGNDNVLSGAGSDSINGGNGNDTLNTGAGDALVVGGAGTDFWVADQSTDTRTKLIDLNLAGSQGASVGTTYESIERISIFTGSGADKIMTRLSGGGSDTVVAGAGNDTIGVGEGADVVNGGDDLDTLIIDWSARLGNFSMNGAAQITNFVDTNVSFTNIERFNVTLGAGNDNVILGALADTIDGGAGNDLLNTGKGLAQVTGGTGTDTWVGDLSDATANLTVDLNLTGSHAAGGGSFYNGLEALNLTTGAGNDILTTLKLGLNDNLSTGAGDDVILVGGGGDAAAGGEGNDLLIIDYTGLSGNFSMNGVSQITNFVDTTINFSGIENFNVTLNNGNANITLLGGNDTVVAGSGNDVFNTATGDATVDGGAGNDQWIADISHDSGNRIINLNVNTASIANIEAISLTTGAGNDLIITHIGQFNDAVATGDGNDIVVVAAGLDTINGGLGDDVLTIDYSAVGSAFSMNGLNQITNFAGTGVSFSNVERILATFGSGADNVVLTDGNDTVTGGLGNDSLNGGLGQDTMNWRDATGGIFFTLSATGGGVVGAAGIGTDTFTGFENLLLGSGSDRVIGNAADNILSGGSGDDTLRGNGGRNTLVGEEGFDRLIGGNARDVLIGGLGADLMSGGSGQAVDTFVFNSVFDSGITAGTRDRITDFTVAHDKIDVSAIDPYPTDPLLNTFVYIGAAGAFGNSGQIRAQQSGLNTVLHFNLDIDAGSEMQITLENVIAANLTFLNFIL